MSTLDLNQAFGGGGLQVVGGNIGPWAPTTPEYSMYNNYLNPPTQEVLSANTGPAGSPPPSTNNTSPTPTDGGSTGPSAEEIYRQQQINAISGKWDNYFNQLDQIAAGVPGQAETMTSSAQLAKDQSTADLQASTDENKSALNKQAGQAEQFQVKTLKDIASNIRNLMQAGNVYLGARGAGDSSAANQYAYALTKVGSQRRGDVMSQTQNTLNEINDRLAKVGNVYTQEKQRINTEYNMRVNQITQWMAEKQEEIKYAKAQGMLDRGVDIQNLSDNLYNIAVQNISRAQQDFQNQSNAIKEWALNNSKTLQEAQQKMQGMGSFMAQQPGYSPISGTPQFDAQGNMNVRYGGYSDFSDDEKRRLGLA